MLNTTRKKILAILVCIILYALLANARSLDESFLEAAFGLKLAIIVIAGNMFGSYIGASVGIGGAVVNGLITGNVLEWISILGNLVIGVVSGLLARRFMSPVAALSLLLGYAVNLTAANIFGVVPAGLLASSTFWWGLTLRLLGGIFAGIIGGR